MKIIFISIVSSMLFCGMIFNFAMSKEISSKYNMDYSSVKIYFVQWDIMTRVMLSPEDVRRMRHFYIEINDTTMILKVVDAVNFNDFQERDNSQPEPARLVIDFIKNDKVIKTVYANKSHILNEKSTKSKDMTNDVLHSLLEVIALNGVK